MAVVVDVGYLAVVVLVVVLVVPLRGARTERCVYGVSCSRRFSLSYQDALVFFFTAPFQMTPPKMSPNVFQWICDHLFLFLYFPFSSVALNLAQSFITCNQLVIPHNS